MSDGNRARRRQLARDLEQQVGDDPRLNAVALRHVLVRTAAPGLLAHRVFADHEIFFDPRDDKIGFTLLQGREWQRRYMVRAVAVLRDHDALRADGIYVDVGANIGCTVLYAMCSGAFRSAVAFEPEPHNRSILERNLRTNAFDMDVDVIAAAAGGHAGMARLNLDARNFGKHAIALAADATSDVAIDVPVVRLDESLADRDIRLEDVALIKVDAEGFEGAVLAGAGMLLERATPQIIEVSGFMSRPDVAGDVMKTLSGPYATCVRLDREPWTVVAEPVADFAAECDQHELLVF